MQQLAYTADTTVTQMVNIIGNTQTIAQVVQIVDGSKDIIHSNSLANQAVTIAENHFLLLFHIASCVQNCTNFCKVYFFVDAQLCTVKGEELVGIYSAIGKYFYLYIVLTLYIYKTYTSFFCFFCCLTADFFTGSNEQFPCQRSNYLSCSHCAGNASSQGQLFVHLVATKTGQIIAAGVKEQAV